MNSWGWTRGDELNAAAAKGGWTVFRTSFQPFASVQESGGRIVFNSLVGRAEVWLDGVLLGRKQDDAAGQFVVPLPPGGGARTLSVLVQSRASQPFGFGDIVAVEN